MRSFILAFAIVLGAGCGESLPDEVLELPAEVRIGADDADKILDKLELAFVLLKPEVDTACKAFPGTTCDKIQKALTFAQQKAGQARLVLKAFEAGIAPVEHLIKALEDALDGARNVVLELQRLAKGSA